jgi:ribosome-binding protein aMBF1 (putative translation factor)
MQSFHLENITLLLSLQPVHIKVTRIPYPPHWRAGQRLSRPPQSLGERIRKHRLELHWLQADLAKAIGVHVISVSNWERGFSTPSRRMMKRIQEFLDYTSTPMPASSTAGLCAGKCEANENAAQLCLFEKIFK